MKVSRLLSFVTICFGVVVSTGKGWRSRGELFLNLNPTLGKGEFSLKDSDYGDYRMQELANVL